LNIFNGDVNIMTTIDTYMVNKRMYLDLNKLCDKKDTIEMIKNSNLSNYVLGHGLSGGCADLPKDPRNDFYFTHMVVGGEKVLRTILEDGFLRPGKDVTHSHILSANKLDHIYGNINFGRRSGSGAQPWGDLNNIENMHNTSLQFSPQLILDYGIIFNRGWGGITDHSIVIHGSDQLEEKYNKLNKIKEYLKNPSFYPFKVSGQNEHEILIDRVIPLNEYLISVYCETTCSKKNKRRIKKIIEEKYPDAKMLSCPENGPQQPTSIATNQLAK
jgi:hypothetical protein